MSLARNAGTVGGLTALSRVFGFLRDMLLARLLGASLAADAFQLAFVLPNTFRRLFAEGAFSVVFVPMYSRALHGEGEEQAARFADQVLAIFVVVLLGFTALAMLAMPAIVWLLAGEFRTVPGKFELSITLARITFPYLGLVSVVAMLSGLLNARNRFVPGASVPLLLNFVLLAGMGIGALLRRQGGDDNSIAVALAVAVTVAGIVQLGYMLWAVRRAGVRLSLRLPRLTPQVKRLALQILPTTAGAGIYQASQFVDTFFATTLPQGSLSLLKYGDRLHQLPLGIVGIALGTAILPMLSRHIHSGEQAEAQALQARSVEMATLLALPAAAALAVCSPAFVTALFVGGRFTHGDAAVMAGVVTALVIGLPAQVLVKVLQPGFYAREDVRTPVLVAGLALLANIAVNFVVVPRFGIVGLAAATTVTALINVVVLVTILRLRGWFRLTGEVAGRIARQLLATLAMVAVLQEMLPLFADWYAAGFFARLTALAALMGAGLVTFFAAAFLTGALDKQRLLQLVRRGS